jgi:ATP synthase protein I
MHRHGVGSAGRLSSVGLELGIAIIASLLGGWWLDQRLGTDPWLALAGVLVGAFAGFRGLLRALRLHEAEMEREERR